MRSLERPPAKLRARGLPGWLPWLARGHQHVSIWKKLWPIVVSVSGTMLRGRRLCWRRRWPIERLSETSKAGHLRAQGGGQRLEEGSLYNHVVQELSDLLSSDGGILSSGSTQGFAPGSRNLSLDFHKLAAAIFISPGFGVFSTRGRRLGARQFPFKLPRALRACGVRARRACSGHDSMTTFWRPIGVLFRSAAA